MGINKNIKEDVVELIYLEMLMHDLSTFLEIQSLINEDIEPFNELFADNIKLKTRI